ncbi:MAG TPA: SRPBCC domain-containing protein [Phycisphaerales bacterium]|nr:SRPBCC domain-containing protein [Phycisphaerales bacterium]
MSAPRELRKEAFYNYPPQRVWAALTDADALAQWLMPNTFKPVEGHAFQFRVDPMPMLPGTTTNCRVLELVPPRRMVWSWEMEPAKGKKTLPPQVITWELTPKDGGTLLTFTQRSSGPGAGLPFLYRLMMSHGWKTMLKRWLPKVLDSFEQTADGRFAYRRLAKAPNRGHHGTKTLPPEFHT